jgi:hypothetical protein
MNQIVRLIPNHSMGRIISILNHKKCDPTWDIYFSKKIPWSINEDLMWINYNSPKPCSKKLWHHKIPTPKWTKMGVHLQESMFTFINLWEWAWIQGCSFGPFPLSCSSLDYKPKLANGQGCDMYLSWSTRGNVFSNSTLIKGILAPKIFAF